MEGLLKVEIMDNMRAACVWPCIIPLSCVCTNIFSNAFGIIGLKSNLCGRTVSFDLLFAAVNPKCLLRVGLSSSRPYRFFHSVRCLSLKHHYIM